MARIRTIKPEFWRDEHLASVSAEACLLAVGLLNHCDDEGYFNANPKLLESDIFPLRELSNTTTVLLRELCEIGYVAVFSGSDGKTYGQVVNFEKHQVINKKTHSKIKELCTLREDYGSPTVALPSGKERKGSGKGNGNGKERTAPRGSRLPVDWVPSDELADWSRAERPDLDLQKVLAEFTDYWSSVSGAKGVKLNWDATWRNWVRNQKTAKPTASQPMSFAQQDKIAGWKRWEEMTGREHPERLAYEARHNGLVIDVQPSNILGIEK